MNLYTIKELKVGMKDVDVACKVFSIEDERTVTSKKDGSQHKVTEFLVFDQTGSIKLNAWNDDIKKVIDMIGRIVGMTGARVNEFRDEPFLVLGWGEDKIIPLDGDSETEIDVDLSMIPGFPPSAPEPLVSHVKDAIEKKYKLNLIVKVAELSGVRTVKSRKTGRELEVRTALVGDETGSINLEIWNEDIGKTKVDSVYLLKNAYISNYKGKDHLNLARSGSITASDKDVSVDLSINFSNKETQIPAKYQETESIDQSSGPEQGEDIRNLIGELDGNEGVELSTIIERSGLSKKVVMEAIAYLREEGLIYEPSFDKFRIL